MQEEFVERYSRREIEQYVKDWTGTFLPLSFTFREHQFESIVDIVYNISNDLINTQVIEAPTGSGKSLIIMIAAGTLSSEPFEMNSYILCSDLSLYDQYYKFIRKNPMMGFGYVKGQLGNYTCDINGAGVRDGECRISKVSWQKLMNPSSCKKIGYDCALRCRYIQERKKAIDANVTLMTYQLFLYQMFSKEYTGEHTKSMGFDPRTIIFCDECHNIPDMVNSRFSFDIGDANVELFDSLYDLVVHHFSEGDLFSKVQTSNLLEEYPLKAKFTKDIDNIMMVLRDKESSDKNIFEASCGLSKILDDYLTPDLEEISNKLGEYKTDPKIPISKEHLDAFKLITSCDFFVCHLHYFVKAISEVGSEYIVREMSESKKDASNILVKLGCIKEDYIIANFLLAKSKYHVMLSATVGNKDLFFENLGTRFIDGLRSDFKIIPSTFDFDKSPVYVIDKYNMSKYCKEKSFPFVKQMIYETCKKFANFRGLIQTGSYADAREIYYNAPSNIRYRLLLYNDAREKDRLIKEHLRSKNSILIGPTLNEGIDMPDDQCRFILISKVPYPSLGNAYVKKKMKLFPDWYDSTTSNTIIQGIGRGVRNKEDWAITYIFDACFVKLYRHTMSQYSPELQDRIKFL